MENQQILLQIKNLKGRRSYEEKRAAKLGFASLYAYFEHKLQKLALAAEENAAQLERLKIEKELARTAKAEKKKLRLLLINSPLITAIWQTLREFKCSIITRQTA